MPLRLPLPLLTTGAHAGRSARTCALKCGSACFHEVPNTSENSYFGDVVTGVLSRRGALKGALGAIVLAGVPGAVGTSTAYAAPGGRPGRPAPGSGATGLSFTPIPATERSFNDVVVPEGYAYALLARWGDPVVPGAPAFDPAQQNAAAQAQQFGYNCDFVGYTPLPDDGAGSSRTGLLTVNHEYTEADRMFGDAYVPGAPTKEQVDVELAAHGLSVVEIRRQGSRPFQVVPGSRYNRRITATTPMELTGPAAGDDLLKTSADPTGRRVLGTLNNCAGGKTPWGTILSGEENFNQYFAGQADMPAGPTKDAHARYGLTKGASERRWERFYDRFDLVKEPNEAFRFGWVVEVDPSDPTSTPKKRTALGRFKHEAATVTIARDGRVVAYSGDDERFDYVYKFVSKGVYREGDKAHNMTLLDDGDLFVARFDGDSAAAELARYNDPATLGRLPEDGEFDGTGEWIPLVEDGVSRVPGFSVAEVLVMTRLAADEVGATKMDRPEDVERNPVNGRVYLAMTNNTNRGRGTNPGVDEANPRKADADGAVTGNKYGHVVELMEARDDAAARTFAWRLFLVAGNPEDPTTYFAGFPKDRVSPVSCPDNVTFDPQGNLWIGTDGAPGTIGKADAYHAVPVAGPERGRAMQFLSVPAGAEATGPELTPDGRTLFCAVQHPGEGQPASVVWPHGEALPRPSVITVFRVKGEGRIGS